MIIEGSFYKLTPINEHSNMFDLELLYDVGGKNPRKEYKIAAYGIPLETAIEKVAFYSVYKKFEKTTTLTLKAYLNEFIAAKNDIKSQITQ